MWVSGVFERVLRISIEASFIVLAVLFFKLLMRNKLGPKWQYLVWGIPMLKLLMPFSPKCMISVFNIFTFMKFQPTFIGAGSGLAHLTSDFTRPLDTVNQSTVITGSDNTGAMTASTIESSHALIKNMLEMLNIVSFVWFAGIVILCICFICLNLRFKAFIKVNSIPTNSSTIKLLEECKAFLGIKKNIPVLTVNGLRSPAMFGFFSPCLLIPVGAEKTMGLKSLKYVFLHELSHIKRHDTAVRLVTSILLAIHWFNPVMWYGYFKMKQDSEVACDAYVLSVLNGSDLQEYGLTILKAYKLFKESINVPLAMGMLGNKHYAEKRITAIVSFNRKIYRLPITSVMLLIVLAVVLLTGAVEPKVKPIKDINISSTDSAKGKTDSLNRNEESWELVKSTKHFEFYYSSSDKEYIKMLSDSMENSFKRVSVDIGNRKDQKLVIKVWPSRKSFEKAIGNSSAPSWIISARSGKTINLLSPAYFIGMDIFNIGVHDLTHILINDINPDNNIVWVHEGIEAYEAGEMGKEYIKNRLHEEVIRDKIPSISELSGTPPSAENDYEYCYTIVDFILNEFGSEKLSLIISSPYDFKNNFGIDENKFEKKWIEFLKKNYQ